MQRKRQEKEEQVDYDNKKENNNKKPEIIGKKGNACRKNGKNRKIDLSQQR